MKLPDIPSLLKELRIINPVLDLNGFYPGSMAMDKLIAALREDRGGAGILCNLSKSQDIVSRYITWLKPLYSVLSRGPHK